MEDDKIASYDEQKRAINTIKTDFKAEVVVAGLIRQGYDPERTIIVRKGAGRRGYSKDVDNVHIEFSQQDLTDYLHVEVNRQGIYDTLPEGLFHQSSPAKKKTKADILQEIQVHRNEEFFARRFFHPFEIAVDQALVHAQLYERKLDKRNINRNFVDIFSFYWPIIRLLPLKRAVLFMNAVPVLRNIVNDFKISGKIMSVVMDMPVFVSCGKKTILKADDSSCFRLGNARLGNNWILGNQCDNGEYNVLIEVGPISAKDMEGLIGNRTGAKILDALIKLIIPCDREVDIKYKLIKEDAKFVLTRDGQMSYLGINTYL